jgi:hypothetical protein
MVQMLTFEGSLSLPVSFFSGPFWHVIQLGVLITCKGYHVLLYKSQQDAHVTEFILSDNCSTCFGHHHYPFSGAQTTLSTAFDNRYTIINRVKFTDKEYR